MWWFLKRVCTVLWMIIVYQVLPTFDQVSDIQLGIAWASTRPPWALAILCIYIMHVLFTSFLWYHLEPRRRKKFTWIFVIFACYPQYRAGIMIKDAALNNEEKLKKETEIYENYLSCLEAFVEAIPQVAIYTASFLPYLGTFTGSVDDSENLGLVACGVPDSTKFSPTAGYHARWFKTCFSFKLKYVISFISASYGITKFYKLSPMKFISNKGILNGLFTPTFLFCYFGNICFMFWRFVMLACMITSTVNLIPWIIPKVDQRALGQKGHCNNLLGISTSEDIAKIQNNDIYQPAKDCDAKCGGGYVECDGNGNPLWGSCRSDCDCSVCAPFCSAISIDSFGYCQQRPGFGRRVRTKEECKTQFLDEEKNPSNCKCREFTPTFSNYNNSSKCTDENPSLTKYVFRKDLITTWNKDSKIYGFELKDGLKYIILWDNAGQTKYGFPPNDCLTNQTRCIDWAINEDFYCTGQASAGVITWFGIFIVPTILLNLTTLVLSLKSQFFKVVFFYPPLLFQGIFGLFLYETIYSDNPEKEAKLKVSVPFSVANGLLCILQEGVAIFILSYNYGWKFAFKFGGFDQKLELARSEEAKNWTEAMEMEIILSVFFLAMTFLTSASILFNLQKTDEIVKGEDIEMNEMEVLGN